MTIEKSTDIAEIWNFSPDFPELAENLIERPHLLSTMAEALSADAPLLFLEGQEGDGATTTLAQFCKAFPDQTFSLFIRPASSLTYGVEYLRLALAEQIHWHLNRERLKQETLTASEFDVLRLKLLRKERNKVLYFIVDGIHQIPLEDRAVISQIFKELLPTGLHRCRIIVTGNQSELGPYVHSSVKSKHYQLLKFSLDECRHFFSATQIDEAECKKIYELCKGGSPGRLAIVRRLLLKGIPLSELLETEAAKYLDFVKLEFKSLDSASDSEKRILAGVAFSKISTTVPDLADTFEMPLHNIATLVSNCAFLRVSASQLVEFLSETHRKFALKRLEKFERSALEAQLGFLQKNPKSDTSLRFLPSYLETLNRQEALIQLLSKDHYSDLLNSTQSLAALKEQAELGTKSAFSLKRTNDVFKFSVQRSIFYSASGSAASPERIRALVALGKPNAAMALANSESTKEGRLTLLSAFGRRFVERHGDLDSDTVEHIRNLIAEIDFSSMGDQAIQIAADVLSFDPDAALGIIESAVKGATDAVKNNAYAELSINTSIAKLKSKRKIEDKAQTKISDQALQQIAHSFQLMVERLEPSRITSLLEKMPASHQVHFLRSLVNVKRADQGVVDLIELGLDVIIREAEYTPRAKDLAELCIPFLSPIADHSRLKKLVTRFDSQLGLVGSAAKSKDLTTLQMRLAAAEYQFDEDLARDRIARAYYEVADVKTPEVQLECLAIMLGILVRIDKTGSLETREGFRATIRHDLNTLIQKVLKETADHVSTVMPVLKALATDDCEAALLLASQLNTLRRRDTAYRTIAEVLVGQQYTTKRFESLVKAIDAIDGKEERAQATENLLAYLDTNSSKDEWLPRMEQLRGRLARPYSLSYWDCWMFKAAAKAGITYARELFDERIKGSLGMVGSTLEESTVQFRAAEALAEADPAAALAHYNEGNRVSAVTPFGNNETIMFFEVCLSLVGRSLEPLARTDALDADKLSRHAALVDKLPGVIPRVRVLNEFAERMWCAKRSDLTVRIVNEQIRPLLEYAHTANLSLSRVAVRIAFPSLCAAHQSLSLSLLADLADSEADEAITEAATLKLRHLSGQEPESNGKFDHSKVEATDVVDVIQLISHARADSTIFELMKGLVEAIVDKNYRTRFTATQKADWSAQLKGIIDERLPDPKNIKHAGYHIVCMALVYALSDQSWTQWEALEAQADAIDNCADRAYIMTVLAAALPSKHAGVHRKRMFEKAVHDIQHIPSPIDRLSHLHDYAKDAHAGDAVASARESLKAAMRLSMEIEDHAQVVRHRRELIDLADQIDPGLADELVELVDDDPARAQLKSEAKEAVAFAKAKRELANAKKLGDAQGCDQELLPDAAWKNLGALQSGRLEVKPPEVLTQYVSMSADGTLRKAYPVLCWHLANLARKYTQPQDVKAHLTPLSEALLLSAELAYAVLVKATSKDPMVSEEQNSESLLVKRRTREEAMAFVEDWLRRNSTETVIYCDAYFSSNDIQLLKICLANAPGSRLIVLASKPHLQKVSELSEEPFIKAWREASDQDPPETEIIAPSFVETPGRHVIHDRWLVTDAGALRLGTSLNSLGTERLSELSEVGDAQADILRTQLGKYVSRQRVVDGARIAYSTFTL